MAKPTAEQAFGAAPKPTAHQAFGPPPKAPEQPGMFSRMVQGASDVFSDAFMGVENTVRNIPKNFSPGKSLVEPITHPIKAITDFGGRLKTAVNEDVVKPARDLAANHSRPYDKTKGWLAAPAYWGHEALGAAGVAAGVPQALIEAGPGNDLQNLTGIDRKAAGVVGSMMAPGIPLGRITGRAGRLVRGAAGDAKAAGQRAFSPEHISEDARDTATLHRAAHGVQRGQAAAEHYVLERHQRVVGNATPAEQRALANHVDTGGRVKIPEKLKPAAEAMRAVYARYRSRIENTLGADGPKFIKDYYARMWANTPEEVDRAMAGHSVYGGKQGSGKNLRKRTIPTYQEGLDRGLTPKFANPIDATNAYVDNMATYLATHDTIKGMRDTGLAKWAFENKVPKGFVKLEGIGTTKAAALSPKGALLPNRVLVADENVARVYNRTAGKGFTGPLYRSARAVSNGVSQVKLGLSLFHATVMGEEGFVSAFSKGANRVLRGDVGGLKGMATSPFAAVATARRGGNLRRAVLDPNNAAFHLKGMDPRLVEQFQRAGGRVNMERFYGTQSASGGFYRSIRNGTLARDVTDAMKRVGRAPIKGSLELVGKVLDTVAAPIFKEYVPRMKAGAWASRMEQWLKDNPEASMKEQQRYAEGLTNNIDNRFGELIQDNQFWEKTHFQIAQLLMLSPSWNFGTVREIGGGLAELPKSVRMATKGMGITDKTAYVGSLAATFMIQNGIATYMHTGQMPEGQDWMAYRTGGTDKDGAPERGLIPGYMKDVLAFTYNFPHNVMTEVQNKANPALSLASQLVTNKDHFDKPVYNPAGSLLEQLGESAEYVGEQMAPISMSQPSRGPDTGFTTLETMLGVRKAPAYLENPERKEMLDKKYGERAWRSKLKGDAKRTNQAGAASPAAKPTAEDAFGPAPKPTADEAFGPSTSAAIKPGATSGGSVRPEFKPVVDFISRLPGVDRITAENDMYHPASDVHGQGRAMDFSIKGGKAEAAAFASRLRQKLHAEGFTRVRVLDEYNNPSRHATGGHIHVYYT